MIRAIFVFLCLLGVLAIVSDTVLSPHLRNFLFWFIATLAGGSILVWRAAR